MKIKRPSIFIIVLFLIAGYFIFPWVAMSVVRAISPNPPQPEIKYGEFPFRLVYDIRGEQKVVEDAVICEYDGIAMNEGVGKYRKWKSSLMSNNEEYIVLLSLFDGRKIVYPFGNADYYMGEDKTEYYLFPNAIILRNNGSNLIRAAELKKEYDIELISWEASPAIQNTFR